MPALHMLAQPMLDRRTQRQHLGYSQSISTRTMLKPVSLLSVFFIITASPVQAAEMELWKGLWSGMSKAQVEARLPSAQFSCRLYLGSEICTTKSPYLTLQNESFLLQAYYEKARLRVVTLNLVDDNGCSFLLDPQRRASCYTALKDRLREAISVKYGSSYVVDSRYYIGTIWKAGGLIISLSELLPNKIRIGYSKSMDFDGL